MLTRIQNDRGTISIDENIISDMIARGVRSYRGRVWVANYRGLQTDELAVMLGNLGALAEKEIRLTEDGKVYVKVYLVIRIDTSIKDAARSIIDSVARGVIQQLRLELDDVCVVVTGMLSPKGKVAKRNIVISYKNGAEAAEDDYE